MTAACWCCGEPAPIRGEDDPWEGRLDGYCVSCATTRCDTTDSTCAVKSAAQAHLRPWIERIKEAEKIDAQFGLYIPGDSALAVVFCAMEEAAYAGDPEFDSRVMT